MGAIFHPILPFQCPHRCHFCGIPFNQRYITAKLSPDEELFEQFDNFIRDKSNSQSVKRLGRVEVATNGSVVPEVPKSLRGYIMAFCQENDLRFESEIIATYIDPEKITQIYNKFLKNKAFGLTDDKREAKIRDICLEINEALNKEFVGEDKDVLLNTGLEVANEEDLRELHKYTSSLEDFIAFAEYLHERGIKVGTNVLLGPPLLNAQDTPTRARKAFESVQFAFETMKAEKIYLVVWVPNNMTKGKRLYDDGKVGVMSNAESCEINAQVKEAYPDRVQNIEFIRMYSSFHHAKQDERLGIVKTDRDKQRVRKEVKRIAQEVFG